MLFIPSVLQRGVREQIAAVKTGSNEYNGQIAEARERINAIRYALPLARLCTLHPFRR